jgi:ubiquinone biosynthesis protein
MGMPADMIELQPLIAACLADAPRDARIRSVQSMLAPGLRDALGRRVAQTLSLETLIPDVYSQWRPLIRDSFQLVFSRLSDERLAEKLVDQADLPLDTPPAARLLSLIARMPGIQKVGQVLARHRDLGEELCRALSELENGMSDMSAAGVRALITEQLGTKLREYTVRLNSKILSEASVSAVLRFTWRNPESQERERAVFKVLKPNVPSYFAEDLALLQQLGEFVAANQGYGFASQHVAEMVSEVRLLLERELDFEREQSMLSDAFQTYRRTLGIRVPRLITPLCTRTITAMSEEAGVKITEAFPGKIYQRRSVADQLVEALVAVPLLSRDENAFFHADPHAGNLLYDERRHEVVILDWALTERLSRDLRRHLTLLVIMTVLRNAGGVSDEIQSLGAIREPVSPAQIPVIRERAERFFKELPYERSPGALDAMRLLDEIALQGVRFPAALAMFQKAMFTLDDVLFDVAGSKVSISSVLVRDFVVRLMASFGLNHPPLSAGDLLRVPKGALLYPSRLGAAALRSPAVDEPDAAPRESE